MSQTPADPARRRTAAMSSLACVTSVLVLGGVTTERIAQPSAQIRFAVVPRASYAWWQITPHAGHLWATTCPEEPSWQPGDVYSPGFIPKYEVTSADTLVPLYPRYVAQAVCTPAVDGEVFADDTTTWHGVRGLISVRAAALVTGSNMRDDYARKRVLQTGEYPFIQFRIDSLTEIRTGDTLRAIAVGEIELHGVTKAMAVPIKAWREKLGLRVTSQFGFPAVDLVDEYQIPLYPIALGVGLRIWKRMNLGVDVILVREGAPTGSN